MICGSKIDENEEFMTRMGDSTRWSSSTESFHSNTAAWIHFAL